VLELVRAKGGTLHPFIRGDAQSSDSPALNELTKFLSAPVEAPAPRRKGYVP
jgi:hypothetical protein